MVWLQIRIASAACRAVFPGRSQVLAEGGDVAHALPAGPGSTPSHKICDVGAGNGQRAFEAVRRAWTAAGTEQINHDSRGGDHRR